MAKYFVAEMIPKWIFYGIIQPAKIDFGYERNTGSGRTAKKLYRNKVTVKKRVSQKQATREFKIVESYVNKKY